MKICKKFLAVMLTLAMVFSMCAFTVSAYDTPTLFSKMDFNALTLGTSYTRSTSFVSTDYHSSYSGGNTIYVRSNGTGSVNVAGTEEDKYISTSWTTGVGHNYIYTYWNMNDNGIASTNNTLHIGYDVMVPATAKDTTTGHYELRCFNTSTSGSYKSNYYATVSINVTNGEISATVDNTNSSATNTASVDKAVAVKGDD